MGSVGIEMNNSVSLLLRTKISLWISGIRRLLYKVLVLINNAAATLSIFVTLLFFNDELFSYLCAEAVVVVPAASRSNLCTSVFPELASVSRVNMSYSFPEKSVKTPPASATSKAPAAVSHAFKDSSM